MAIIFDNDITLTGTDTLNRVTNDITIDGANSIGSFTLESSNTIILTRSSGTFAKNQTYTIEYTQNAGNPLFLDSGGNPVSSFSQSVTTGTQTDLYFDEFYVDTNGANFYTLADTNQGELGNPGDILSNSLTDGGPNGNQNITTLGSKYLIQITNGSNDPIDFSITPYTIRILTSYINNTAPPSESGLLQL